MLHLILVLSWILAPCGFVGQCQRFRETCFLYLQGWRRLNPRQHQHHTNCHDNHKSHDVTAFGKRHCPLLIKSYLITSYVNDYLYYRVSTYLCYRVSLDGHYCPWRATHIYTCKTVESHTCYDLKIEVIL